MLRASRQSLTLSSDVSDVPCDVSESFALACFKAFSCLPNLKTLYIYAGCSQEDLTRLVSGIHGTRALQSLTVNFVEDNLQQSRLLQELAVLVAVLPKLTKMSLGCPDAYVSIEPFLTVPGTLSPSLTNLKVDSCYLPDLPVITAPTQSSLSGIKILQLHRCQFPLSHCDPVGYVCTWMPYMPGLATLCLYSFGSDNGVPSDYGFCLWRALCTNGELKRLCRAIVDHPTLRSVTFALGCSNQCFPAMQ